MNSYNEIKKSLQEHNGTPEKVKILSSFFKTGKGEYGEGDQFLGVTVPDQRKIAKQFFKKVTFDDIEKLLSSKWHEHRLTGLFLLVYRYEKADEKEKKEIYTFYLEHLEAVNNWDLVDTTTPNIVGAYMCEHEEEKKKLKKWAKSQNLWERRIAVLATYACIKKGEYNDTIKLAEMLLRDYHDLIHKAVGWMLREVGKKDEKILCNFLDKYAHEMPRTMLRYAIERLEEKMRKHYLSRKV